MLCKQSDTRYTTAVKDEFRKKDISIIAYYELWDFDAEGLFWGLTIRLKAQRIWDRDFILYNENKIKTLEEAKEIARLYVENNFTTGL